MGSPPPASKETRYQVHEALAFRLVDGEVFALTRDHTFHAIDYGTGATIFTHAVDAPRSVRELVDHLAQAFALPDDRTQVALDVEEFAEALVAKGVFVRIMPPTP